MLARIFDAAYPPATVPPGCTGVLGYVSGQRATRIWTPSWWLPFAALRQFPAMVPNFTIETPEQAALDAVDAVQVLGWAAHEPDERVILVDSETLVEPGWYQRCAEIIGNEGFTPVDYGSESTILLNAAEDVWVAAWDGATVLEPGQTIHAHQYAASVSFGGTQIDLSVADEWLMARGGIGPRNG